MKINDILNFIKELFKLEKIHPNLYRYCDNKEIFDQKLYELVNSSFDEDEVRIRLMELLALLKDGHTTLNVGDEVFPIEFSYRNNKVYVKDQYKNKELTHVCGIEISSIIAVIEKHISYDNESRRVSLIEQMLSNWDFMHLILKTRFNEEITKDNFSYTIDGKEVSFKETTKKQPKLKISKSEDKKTLNFICESCDGGLVPNIESEFKKFKEALSSDYNKIIIDLRGNNGGQSSYLNECLDLLKDQKENGTEIIVRVDEHTFSSAVLNMVQLQSIGAIVYGECPGLCKNHFGNCGKGEILGLSYHYSQKEFLYIDKEILDYFQKNIDYFQKNNIFTEEQLKNIKIPLIVQIYEQKDIDSDNVEITILNGKKITLPKCYLHKREDYVIMSEEVYNTLKDNPNLLTFINSLAINYPNLLKLINSFASKYPNIFNSFGIEIIENVQEKVENGEFFKKSEEETKIIFNNFIIENLKEKGIMIDDNYGIKL